jgi:hypothetical protein
MKVSRTEALGLGLLFVIFTWFTWRGMTMFFSGDDMMNMYRSWDTNGWLLARAQVLIWEPVYRPVGAAIYRLFYDSVGFHPQPLYVFCWLLLALNVFAGYFFFRETTATVAAALTALSLVLIHGSFTDLYYSAGTIYDRLCFLFTTLAVIVYFRFRRQASWRSLGLICLFAILAMGSKESGVALLPILLCCECIFFVPDVLRKRAIASWFRQTAPLFSTLAALSLIFVLGRVDRTPELMTNASYQPHGGLTGWMNHVAQYFGMLAYGHVRFTITTAGILLLVMAAVAIAIRSRTMLFGWVFFVISVTPVALITSRPAYVLYLPDLGLGLFFAGAIAWITGPVTRKFAYAGTLVFVLVTIAIAWFHLRNWAPPWNPRTSPEMRLTEQFRREYAALPPTSKLLFVSDEFPFDAYDLLFNLRLLYRNKSIVVYRLQAPPDQRPDPSSPPAYDHIFAAENGRYVELDLRNPSESVRLNVLRDYPVSREMDMAKVDHSAYVVSGLKDVESDQPTRWTDPHARFKFKLDSIPKVFTAKFWLPEVVAAPTGRTVSILLNGRELETLPLDKPGMNEVSLPVPPSIIQVNGYTFVEMNVANPYTDADHVQYGVLLLRAGFK